MNLEKPSLNTAEIAEHKKYQDALIAMGIPLCEPGGTGEATVREIDRLIMRRFRYTRDKDVPFNERLRIPGGVSEFWRSHHEQFTFETTPILDDCDGYTATALQLAVIMGVPQNRLAFGIVVSESALKVEGKSAKMENVDHAIGMYWDGKTWLTFGDTWGQTSSPSITRANVRHRVMAMAIVDEGLTWRSYAE